MPYEEIPIPNMTTTMLTLQFGLNDRMMTKAIYAKISQGITELMTDIAPEMVKAYHERLESSQPFDFSGLFTFLDEKEALLDNVLLNSSDAQQVTDEYRNAIRLLRAGTELQYYIEKRTGLTRDEKIERLNSLRKGLDQYLIENKRLWMLRNKPGGYERSTAAIQKLILQIDDELAIQQKSLIQRSIYRIGTMITTSFTTLYLKIT